MVTNSFGNLTPYQYYNNADPANQYDMYGRRKGAEATVDQLSTTAAHAIPVVGGFIGAADSVSQPLKATNTGWGDVASTLITPYHQAVADFASIGHGGLSAGQKAENFGKGLFDLISPEFSAIMAASQGAARRRQEGAWKYQQQFANGAGYSYGLDNNGVNYASHLRPINSYSSNNPHPEVAAAVNGIASTGANLLKQFLARPKTVSNVAGGGANDINFANPYTPNSLPNAPQNPDGNVNYGPSGPSPNTLDYRGNGVDNTSFGQNPITVQNPQYGQLGSNLPIDTGQGVDSTVGIQGFSSSPNDAASIFQSGAGATDFSSDIPDVTEGMHKGGKTWAYETGGVAHVTGGKGKDDIALVDANTGRDTNIRVEKGEMIVFSKDNVDAITEAVKKGDQNKLFSLVADQIKQKGKVKNGNLNHAGGGVAQVPYNDAGGTAYPDLSKLTDAQLATAFHKLHWMGYNKENQTLLRNVGDEFSRRGLREEGVNDKGTLDHRIYYDKSGKAQNLDDAFDLESWRKGNAEQATQAVNNSNTTDNLDPMSQVQRGIQKWNIAHPVVQTALAAKHMNGAPQHKLTTDGKLATLDPNGNMVGTPYGPAEAGFDSAGNPLGPYNPAATTPQVKGGGPSKTTYTPLEDIKHPIDYVGALGYGADAAKFALGAVGAETPLPNWQVPGNWVEYSNEAKHKASEGLSPYQIALAQNGADNSYLTALERNRNIGGGNAGLIMSADNLANQNHNTAALQLAAADHAANLNNFRAYAPIVEQDVNNSRTLYNDQNDRAMWTKQSGAAMMNRAQDDAVNHAMTDQYYGPHSDYQQLFDLTKQKSQAEINAINSNQNLWLQKYQPTA